MEIKNKQADKLIKIGIIFIIIDIIFCLWCSSHSTEISLLPSFISPPVLMLALFLIILGLYKKAKDWKKNVLLVLILILIYGFYAFQSIYTEFSFEKILAIKTQNEIFCRITIFPLSSCFSEIARLKKDVRICEYCKYDTDECYLNVVKITGDVKICDVKICEKTADVKFCEKTTDIQSYRNECYLILAEKYQNPDFCDKMNDTYTFRGVDYSYLYYNSSNCYISLAKILKDESICQRIKTSRDECYFDVTEVVRDIRICEKIKDDFKKTECINKINKFNSLD